METRKIYSHHSFLILHKKKYLEHKVIRTMYDKNDESTELGYKDMKKTLLRKLLWEIITSVIALIGSPFFIQDK